MAVSNTVMTALKNKAKEKNVPVDVLVQVYERGESAWLTGSRPGIGMAQWAMARVNSFIRAISQGPKKHDTDLHDVVKDFRRKQLQRRNRRR